MDHASQKKNCGTAIKGLCWPKEKLRCGNQQIALAKRKVEQAAVSLLSNLETAQRERSMLLSVEQKLLVKEGKSGCA